MIIILLSICVYGRDVGLKKAVLFLRVFIFFWWWVDPFQVRSECPLPPIAHSLLCLSSSVPPLSPFLGRQGSFPEGYQCPCPWLAIPPCKKHPQPPPMLEAEVVVGAIGTGEVLATAPIQVCWGVRLCRPLRCRGTRGACLSV